MEVPCFDLNAACATFGMNINFLLRMQPETLPPYVLVVNVEKHDQIGLIIPTVAMRYFSATELLLLSFRQRFRRKLLLSAGASTDGLPVGQKSALIGIGNFTRTECRPGLCHPDNNRMS